MEKAIDSHKNRFREKIKPVENEIEDCGGKIIIDYDKIDKQLKIGFQYIPKELDERIAEAIPGI